METGLSELAHSLEREQASRLGQLVALEVTIKSFEQDYDEIRDMCTQIEAKEKETDNFKKMIDELSMAEEALKKLSTREKELSSPQHYDATLERRLFEKTLGLEIRLTEDRLFSLSFKHIHVHDPSYTYKVVLDIRDDGKWEVVDLNPHLHGVDSLLQELNSSGSMTTFCKAFRHLCKQHPGTDTGQ